MDFVRLNTLGGLLNMTNLIVAGVKIFDDKNLEPYLAGEFMTKLT